MLAAVFLCSGEDRRETFRATHLVLGREVLGEVPSIRKTNAFQLLLFGFGCFGFGQRDDENIFVELNFVAGD